MSQKCSSLFYCELCDYKCSKQSVFNKHLSTAKHQKITNGNNNVPLTCKQCFQTFKYRSGLSRHSKKCGMVAPKQLESNTKTCILILYVHFELQLFPQNVDVTRE